jgi:maleylacetate reductase
MGIYHKICHTIGGTYDLPHAPSHSAVIPYVPACKVRAAPAAMAAIEAAFRSANRDIDHAVGAIWDLRNEVGPRSPCPCSAREIDAAADIIVRRRPMMSAARRPRLRPHDSCRLRR